MEDDESFSSYTSEDTDSEYTYANVYSDLFRRSINQYIVKTHPYRRSAVRSLQPKFKFPPIAMKLADSTSHFYYNTQTATTVLDFKGVMPCNNVTSLLMNRQIGRFNMGGFSNSSRCYISNHYLPNEMVTLDSYGGKVFCGMFSKDGTYFITTSQDQFIRLYKSDTGQYQFLRKIHARDVGWSIIDVAFSPNIEHFVYSTWSSALHLCPIGDDPEKQQPLCLVNTTRRFCIFSLAFSSDGNEILGGANDGFICVYNLQLNTPTLKITAHDYDVNTVAFADNSSHIIYSGSDDGLIKVWDRRTLGEEKNPMPVGVLAGHMDGITFIDPKGDGRHLISNSKDQSIKLWDVRVFSSDYAAKNTLQAVHEQTWDYRWQGVPNRLTHEREALEGDTSIMTYRGHVITRTLIRCRFSPLETTGQRYIYTGCGGGRLVIYDALTGKIKVNERQHQACVRDVAWHPHRNEIITSSWDRYVGKWFYTEKEENDWPSEKSGRRKRDSNSLHRLERLKEKKRFFHQQRMQREQGEQNEQDTDSEA